jgi:hypothetical protein
MSRTATRLDGSAKRNQGKRHERINLAERLEAEQKIRFTRRGDDGDGGDDDAQQQMQDLQIQSEAALMQAVFS